jgi:hypothetical protein
MMWLCRIRLQQGIQQSAAVATAVKEQQAALLALVQHEERKAEQREYAVIAAQVAAETKGGRLSVRAKQEAWQLHDRNIFSSHLVAILVAIFSSRQPVILYACIASMDDCQPQPHHLPVELLALIIIQLSCAWWCPAVPLTLP